MADHEDERQKWEKLCTETINDLQPLRPIGRVAKDWKAIVMVVLIVAWFARPEIREAIMVLAGTKE